MGTILVRRPTSMISPSGPTTIRLSEQSQARALSSMTVRRCPFSVSWSPPATPWRAGRSHTRLMWASRLPRSRGLRDRGRSGPGLRGRRAEAAVGSACRVGTGAAGMRRRQRGRRDPRSWSSTRPPGSSHRGFSMRRCRAAPFAPIGPGSSPARPPSAASIRGPTGVGDPEVLDDVDQPILTFGVMIGQGSRLVEQNPSLIGGETSCGPGSEGGPGRTEYPGTSNEPIGPTRCHPTALLEECGERRVAEMVVPRVPI